MSDPAPAQLASIVGGLFAGAVAVGVAVEKIRGWLTVAPTRETVVPPAPQSGQHAGSLLDGDLAALRGRMVAIEQAIESSTRREELERVRREELANQLTRIETKLDERTSRRRDHASREST